MMDAPQLPIDSTDDQIIAAMGQALGFVPALVIAHKIARESGEVVVVLKTGPKLFWNCTPVTQPIEPPAPAEPIIPAPEAIVEARSTGVSTIEIGKIPGEPPRPHSSTSRRKRRSAQDA